MPATVKSVSLWRKEVENQVGVLAQTIGPVSKARAHLRVMGYRYPGDSTKAAIEHDKPGLGLAISGARVNMTFSVAQAIRRKFSAVLGFETEADAKTAAPLIKKAAATKKK